MTVMPIAPANIPVAADRNAAERQLHHLFGELPASCDGLFEVAWTEPGFAAPSRARQFGLDELEDAAEQIVRCADEERNAYLSAGLRRPVTHRGRRATSADVQAVAALWADFDDEGAASAARQLAEDLGIPPTLVVQTATVPHQRCQFWWRLEEPCKDVRGIGGALASLAEVLGGDPAVKDVGRLMRAAGSVAQPVKAGRVAETVEILDDWSAVRLPYTVAEIMRALEAYRPLMGAAVAQAGEPRRNLANVLDFNLVRPRPTQRDRFAATYEPGLWHGNSRDFIGKLVREGVTDDSVAALAPAFCRDGYTVEQTERELLQFAQGARKKGWAPESEANDDAPPEILPLIDLASWEGRRAAPRQWIWHEWIPARQATYLTGAGSAGKSLLGQQLASHIALGRAFLGVDTREAVSLYVTCEDDEDELERRQEAICEALDVSYSTLIRRLNLCSLVGEIGNELATFDPQNRMETTRAWQRLRATALAIRPGFIVLDNVAHLFAGNENIRAHVAAFCALLNALATEIDAAVLFIGHPNKAGDAFSGSTAWENQVRARLFLGFPESADGGFVDRDRRVLSRGKANYARNGESITFRWFRWSFALDNELPTGMGDAIAANVLAGEQNARFLACLAKATEERRNVSSSRSAQNYAPKRFAAMPTAGGMSVRGFEAALERLLHDGVILDAQPVFQRPNRSWVTGLALAPNPAPNPAPTDAQECTDQSDKGL